jgi:hypothetical protein
MSATVVLIASSSSSLLLPVAMRRPQARAFSARWFLGILAALSGESRGDDWRRRDY